MATDISPTGADGASKGSLVVVPFNATMAFDSNNEFNVVTLTNNITAWSVSAGYYDGQMIVIQFVQDGSGSRTLAGLAGGNLTLAGGALALSAGASAIDVVTWMWNVTDGKWHEQCRSMNQS